MVIIRVGSNAVISCGRAGGYKLAECCVSSIFRIEGRNVRMQSAYTGYTQKNGAVSKVNRKFVSHLTRAQRTPSAAATVQVSHTLKAVRSSCLLLGQFPRWRRSRKRLCVCSVLRCPDLWLQCSVNFVHGLEKTHHASFLNRARKSRCTVINTLRTNTR